MAIWGVDTSNWQGNVDWRTAHGAGIRFGWAKVSEGGGYRDPFWTASRDNALSAGVAIGGYHYAHPNGSAEQQADYFIGLHGPMRPGMLPPALDLEESNGVDRAGVHAWVVTWMRRVEAALGVVPVLYTYPNFWATQAGCPDGGCARHPLWFASYTSRQPSPPPPWSKIHVWQYAGTSVNVPGAGNAVDANYFLGSDAELHALTYGATPAPLPEENDEMGFILQSDLGFLHCVGGRLVDIPIDVVGELNAAGAHTILVPVNVFQNYQSKMDHPLV